MAQLDGLILVMKSMECGMSGLGDSGGVERSDADLVGGSFQALGEHTVTLPSPIYHHALQVASLALPNPGYRLSNCTFASCRHAKMPNAAHRSPKRESPSYATRPHKPSQHSQHNLPAVSDTGSSETSRIQVRCIVGRIPSKECRKCSRKPAQC